jgi:hypothetical protein
MGTSGTISPPSPPWFHPTIPLRRKSQAFLPQKKIFLLLISPLPININSIPIYNPQTPPRM